MFSLSLASGQKSRNTSGNDKPKFAIEKQVKYQVGKKLKNKWVKGVIFLSIVCLAAGLYIIFVSLSPKLAHNNAREAAVSTPRDDRLIIPSVDINTPYFSGGDEVLDKGAWHRFAERGDPQRGGNFILAGHRFVMTGSFKRTMTQSRFYNLDKVKKGDSVIVDWKGVRYKYVVNRTYTVKPGQISIENPSVRPKLTIYTCTLGGTYDGRIVVEATPVR